MVPSFIGQTVAVAQPLADAKGLILVTSKFVKGDQPDGTIVDQDPKPDATVAKGATINLTIVTGKAVVPVPDVRNMTESEAPQDAARGGLTPACDGRLRSLVPVDSVASTSPAIGVQVEVGTTVDYVLSTPSRRRA